jgi:hypothetical protein
MFQKFVSRMQLNLRNITDEPMSKFAECSTVSIPRQKVPIPGIPRQNEPR